MARTKQVPKRKIELESSQQKREFANRAARKHATAITKVIKPVITHKQREEAKIHSTDLIFPRTTFKNLVKEIARNFVPDIRFQLVALEALQEAAEDYLIKVFQDSKLLANHANRVTVKPADIQLARKLGGRLVNQIDLEQE